MMSNNTGTRHCLPDLSHLSRTIAELSMEGVRETLAVGKRSWEPVKERIELRRRGVEHYKDTNIPIRNNPFEGTLVMFDRAASRLTILLNLSRSQRVVAELYRRDGSYIKRLFDRYIPQGASEIIGLGCRHRKGEFVITLHSFDGTKNFKISRH